MADPFERLRKLAKAFYEGWKWSVHHQYSETDLETFVNEVEEPLNCEAVRLLNQGFKLADIEQILYSAKQEVWPGILNKEVTGDCVKKTTRSK